MERLLHLPSLQKRSFVSNGVRAVRAMDGPNPGFPKTLQLAALRHGLGLVEQSRCELILV